LEGFKMTRIYGYLFAVALSLAFAGCAGMGGSAYTFKGAGSCGVGGCGSDQSVVTGMVGGFGQPQQATYISGSGCTPPPPVGTPIYVPPAAPAMDQKLMCTSSDARSCQMVYVRSLVAPPVCNVQSITTSGGTPATTWATVAGGLAGLFYLMFK
jgi:hypothetical protein